MGIYKLVLFILCMYFFVPIMGGLSMAEPSVKMTRDTACTRLCLSRLDYSMTFNFPSYLLATTCVYMLEHNDLPGSSGTKRMLWRSDALPN